MRNMGNQKIVAYPLRNVYYDIHLLQNYECLAIFSACTIQVTLLGPILGRFGPARTSIPAASPTGMEKQSISPVAKMLFTTSAYEISVVMALPVVTFYTVFRRRCRYIKTSGKTVFWHTRSVRFLIFLTVFCQKIRFDIEKSCMKHVESPPCARKVINSL